MEKAIRTIRPKSRKSPTFDEYKTIKDEIIEISAERYENILNKRLHEFKKDIKSELMAEINPRFDAILNIMNTRFKAVDDRFDAMDKRLTLLTWLIPLLITLATAFISYSNK
jgi:hypothetical protein